MKNNPINNTVFNSRDLLEYRESLAQGLVDDWNAWQEEHLNNEFEVEDVDDVFKFAENLNNNGSEQFNIDWSDDMNHYEEVANFCDELSNYGDFEYGESIISEDYFEEYCEEYCKDMGFISNDLPGFIENAIDWEKVADDLKMDYTGADFEGTTYYMRA
jgi:hypothetical protein